jgi:hypothetical protein
MLTGPKEEEEEEPNCFVFLETKFVDAGFILLLDKPNSNSYNCVERNLC